MIFRLFVFQTILDGQQSILGWNLCKKRKETVKLSLVLWNCRLQIATSSPSKNWLLNVFVVFCFKVIESKSAHVLLSISEVALSILCSEDSVRLCNHEWNCCSTHHVEVFWISQVWCSRVSLLPWPVGVSVTAQQGVVLSGGMLVWADCWSLMGHLHP